MVIDQWKGWLLLYKVRLFEEYEVISSRLLSKEKIKEELETSEF